MAHLITPEYFQEQMATLGLKSSWSPTAYALDTLIVEASEWVENYTDRKFELQNITEYINGPVRPDRRLIVGQYPVNSVGSAYWEDPAGQTGSIDVSSLRPRLGGIIEWKPMTSGAMYGGYWFPELLYTVTYNTGFSVIPSNVQRATALKVANLVQPQYQGPSEREIFMVTNLEAMIIDLLESYRRERFG